MGNLIEKIRTYYRFSTDEIKSLAIVSLIVGFMFVFGDFSLTKLILAILIVAVSMFVHVSVQKIVSLHIGYHADFSLWWYGLLIGLLVTFLSNGNIWWLVLPGGLTFSIIARHRLGKFRYGLNYKQMGIIALSGPIASIVFGTIFKNIELYIIGGSVPLLHNIFIFNLVLAALTMVPIPPLNGHFMFFASRLWFVLLFAAIAAYAVLVIVFEIYSWIWAIIIGLIIYAVYYIRIEQKLW